MATLASTVIDRVMKKYLANDAVTKITVALSSSDTSISFQVGVPQIGINSTLMIEEELLKVLDVDNTAGTGTVIRGHLGTTAVAHVADTAMYVDPRIQRDDVFPLINNALVDMVPAVYTTATKSLSYSGSAIGYDMAISDGILEV
ncbi:MAG: hypothetical protein QQN63_10840, partial [Nitrosopumilus sp.]